jgi:hypothetical protein
VTEKLLLTDLGAAAGDPGPGRLPVFSGRVFSTWAFSAGRRLLYHCYVAVREVLTALPRDAARAMRSTKTAIFRIEPGIRPDADADRIALYVHYSATGQISEMVRCQLQVLGREGFGIVFISMAERIPDADWQAVRQLAALVVQRPNFGLDFGAWRDLLPEVRRRWSIPQELLLANDSVLGPIHKLAPAIAAMRSGGDGLFGLTESLQGGAHLQSYMLLASGRAAVKDLMHFVQTLKVSHSKWLLVRMGEVRLSRWMLRRGHRVAAVFGYDRLVRATIADPEERRRLQVAYKRFHSLETLSTEAAVAMLHRWPLNPTHHLWRVLATRFDYPFLKTELIRRNPAHLPGVTAWKTLVPSDSPCTVATLEAHIATLEPSNN